MPDDLTPDQAASLGRLVDVYPEARELGERFAAAGHELHLVGGTVRDTLLAGGDADALATVDLDFATSAPPQDTERIVRPWATAVWLTGVEFGTVSCQREQAGRPTRTVEITTYRSDAYTPGSRHPEVRFGARIEDDLARRDLTVNAMAVRVPDFRFVDPYGGLGDLQRRRLRTPIDPATSFGDDPLRMVRLARFAAVLDAQAAPEAVEAASAMAGQLRTISAERVREELVKLITGATPRAGIELLVRTGLARHVLPELELLEACQDPMHRHKDVYAHTLAVVENAMALETDGPDFVLRFAALLHDIGKPDTKEVHRDGTVTFHHHDVVGARMTRQRMRELRFDKDTTRAVSELVRMHLRFHTYKMGWTDAAVRRYVRDAGELLERLNALTRADVTTGNPKKAARIQRRVDDLEVRIVELREQEELDALRPPIDGNQIMQHLQLRPGPLVGEAWSFLLEERLERGPMDESAAYALLETWWAQHPEHPDATSTSDGAAAVDGSR
ncbi:CCA tRNA nucleotidyltransferase [Egicoccus halophilus]|uniref:CCA tRNA nucleotidyltransferase n=1 Tax=Egicoccus halophilus TaxID=1670830 RepID=A0A8J3A7C1_9ACTN|nr:CCA tRNA nucleotidyltransferase [Egicoccus halophilus]GGI03201.1 CCA tRNA nucleotidyltransferase [Egicoccus halophilus]